MPLRRSQAATDRGQKRTAVPMLKLGRRPAFACLKLVIGDTFRISASCLAVSACGISSILSGKESGTDIEGTPGLNSQRPLPFGVASVPGWHVPFRSRSGWRSRVAQGHGRSTAGVVMPSSRVTKNLWDKFRQPAQIWQTYIYFNFSV